MSDSLPTEELRAVIEVERESSLWGRPHKVTPRLVGKVLGDGKQLIWFAPIMSRPNWYVVRIDSGWSLDNHADAGVQPVDWTEGVLLAIEEEYGNADDLCSDDCPGRNDCADTYPHDFPALHDGGESWGPDTLDDYRRRP